MISLKLKQKSFLSLLQQAEHIHFCMGLSPYFTKAGKRLDSLNKLIEKAKDIYLLSPPYAAGIKELKRETRKKLCRRLNELACLVMLETYNHPEEETPEIIYSAGMREKYKPIKKPKPMFNVKSISETSAVKTSFRKWKKAVYITEILTSRKTWKQESIGLCTVSVLSKLPKGVHHIRGKVIQDGKEVFVSDVIPVVVG